MSNVRNVVPIGSLTLGIILAITLHSFFPRPAIIGYPWTHCGTLVIIAGIAQFVASVSLFVRKKTDIRPGGMPTSLIAEGPYRYTRNPIYLANMMVLLGVCLLLGSLVPFIVLPLYFAIVNTFIVPFEERRLISIFGQQYRGYQIRVRRWL